ncbi:MAG: hypothetical protein H6Q04_2473 [Acidobacteria bacterium]|nr:hypothetical protein [Acidobacteriota bacterium]
MVHLIHHNASGELGATIDGMWTLYASLMIISAISQNRLPPLGQIGAFYFESMDESQIWINLEPLNSLPGPNPIKLNFTVAFPGREIAHATDLVEVRAESYNTAFPQLTRLPILRFGLRNGKEVDLTERGKTFQFTYHGLCGVDESCSPDTVIARIPFSELCKIAASNSLKIEALGFILNMRPEDIRSLRRYVQTVQNGVRLSPGQYRMLE